MDRNLKVGMAALLVLAGTAMGQETTNTEPKTGTTANTTTQTTNDHPAVSVVKAAEGRASNSPFWIWNDFLIAVKAIRGEEALADLRTTPEQDKVINAANIDFRTQYGEFMRSNREELTKLRAQLGEKNTNGEYAEKELIEAGKEGGVASKDMQQSIKQTESTTHAFTQGTPEWNAAIKRFREILAQAPNANQFKQRVLDTLSEPQRAEVTKRADAALKNRQNRAFEQANATKDIESVVAAYNINKPEIPQYVRDRWATANTAQRFKMMRGIEQRLKVNKGQWEKPAPADSHSQATAPTQPSNNDPR